MGTVFCCQTILKTTRDKNGLSYRPSPTGVASPGLVSPSSSTSPLPERGHKNGGGGASSSRWGMEGGPARGGGTAQIHVARADLAVGQLAAGLSGAAAVSGGSGNGVRGVGGGGGNRQIHVWIWQDSGRQRHLVAGMATAVRTARGCSQRRCLAAGVARDGIDEANLASPAVDPVPRGVLDPWRSRQWWRGVHATAARATTVGRLCRRSSSRISRCGRVARWRWGLKGSGGCGGGNRHRGPGRHGGLGRLAEGVADDRT